MTEDEIRKMPAGRELDALVAEKVMDWVFYKAGDIVEFGLGFKEDGGVRLIKDALFSPHGMEADAPRYSTDIAAAWQIIEKLQKQHYIHLNSTNAPGCFDVVAFVHYNSFRAAAFVFEPAALGICKAALWLVSQDSLSE